MLIAALLVRSFWIDLVKMFKAQVLNGVMPEKETYS